MIYKYNWIWLMLSILWTGLEAYWAGLAIEQVYPPHITLPIVTISACAGLGFLLAFFNSARDK